MKIKIDATKSEAEAYDEIATLDFGPEDSSTNVPEQNMNSSADIKHSNNNINSSSSSRSIKSDTADRKKIKKTKKNQATIIKRKFLQYKHSGGMITVSQDRMVLHFLHQKEPFMDTQKWRMTGPIYFASAYVFDGLIKTENEEICLSDTSYHSSLLIYPQTVTIKNDGNKSNVKNDNNHAYHNNDKRIDNNKYENHESCDEFYDSSVYSPPLSTLSPTVTEESPASRNGYDICSTAGSYGSAVRTFGFRETRYKNGNGNSNEIREQNRFLLNGSSVSLPASMSVHAPVPVPSRRAVCVVTVVRSAAPMKVYWDATATAASLDIWLDDSTKDLQDSFNNSLVRYIQTFSSLLLSLLFSPLVSFPFLSSPLLSSHFLSSSSFTAYNRFSLTIFFSVFLPISS